MNHIELNNIDGISLKLKKICKTNDIVNLTQLKNFNVFQLLYSDFSIEYIIEVHTEITRVINLYIVEKEDHIKFIKLVEQQKQTEELLNVIEDNVDEECDEIDDVQEDEFISKELERIYHDLQLLKLAGKTINSYLIFKLTMHLNLTDYEIKQILNKIQDNDIGKEEVLFQGITSNQKNNNSLDLLNNLPLSLRILPLTLLENCFSKEVYTEMNDKRLRSVSDLIFYYSNNKSLFTFEDINRLTTRLQQIQSISILLEDESLKKTTVKQLYNEIDENFRITYKMINQLIERHTYEKVYSKLLTLKDDSIKNSSNVQLPMEKISTENMTNITVDNYKECMNLIPMHINFKLDLIDGIYPLFNYKIALDYGITNIRELRKYNCENLNLIFENWSMANLEIFVLKINIFIMIITKKIHLSTLVAFERKLEIANISKNEDLKTLENRIMFISVLSDEETMELYRYIS